MNTKRLENLKGRLLILAGALTLVLALQQAYMAMENYAKTHYFTQSRYCWNLTSAVEKMPFWGDPVVDDLCVYANPFEKNSEGTTMVNGSFGPAQFVVDLFPSKTKWDSTFGTWKYRARATFVTEDWEPFGPQWGIELVYNVAAPDWQIEEGWILTLGNTTGGKGFETYIGTDGNCYIRKIPDNRAIRVFVPVK